MNIKKILNKTNFSLSVIIIIGILAVLNFFSYNIFYRFDLTRNKDYSLSPASKRTAAGLNDIVNIKAYFSSDLPSQYINLRQETGDILDEYANYSGGKIKIEFIDPKDDEEIKRELYSAGIPRLQFNVLEKDKYQVVNGYLGLLIKYGDKFQAIPVIENTGGLEYQLTSAIKKITSSKVANIGFWRGNGAADLNNDISVVYEKTGEVYNVSAVDFSSEKKIPEDLDSLIIIGPKEEFKDEELGAIAKFLKQGGSLVILANGVTVDQGLSAKKNDLGLNKILGDYGLKLNNDLVLDVNNGLASFSQGFVTFTTNYPYWPKVVRAGFDQNNLAVSELESLVLPWASSIDVDEEKTGGLLISYLAATSNSAMAVADNFDLSPQARVSDGGRKKFNLAVSLSGKFGEAGDKTGRLIIAGDSEFISDNFLRNYPDNLLFFQNLVDGFSLGEDLITIRSKGVTERPLKDLAGPAKAAVRYLNIFGLTAVVMLAGLLRYYLRRKRAAEI